MRVRLVDVQVPILDEILPGPFVQQEPVIAFQRQAAPPADVVEIRANGLQVAVAFRQHLHHDLGRTVELQAYVLELRGRKPIGRATHATHVACDVQQQFFLRLAKRVRGPQCGPLVAASLSCIHEKTAHMARRRSTTGRPGSRSRSSESAISLRFSLVSWRAVVTQNVHMPISTTNGERGSLPMPAFYRLPDVLRMTGLSRPTLYRRIAACRFPKPVHLGGRTCGWAHAALQEWIADPEGYCAPGTQAAFWPTPATGCRKRSR